MKEEELLATTKTNWRKLCLRRQKQAIVSNEVLNNERDFFRNNLSDNLYSELNGKYDYQTKDDFFRKSESAV
jgi:hypothetical protein